MAEIKMKSLVLNVGGKAYRMVGSRLEDICDELAISEERFIEILSRDAYCPTLSAAPTSSTLTYVDTDGSTNHFHVGQLCRWAVGDDYRMAVCKDATETATSWYVLPTKLSELTDDKGYLESATAASTYATKTALTAKQDKVLKFENVAAASWVSDATYADFPFRCDMACEGVTSDNYAEVVFALEQAASGMYAPLCATGSDIVSIWSASDTTITVPTVIITI